MTDPEPPSSSIHAEGAAPTAEAAGAAVSTAPAVRPRIWTVWAAIATALLAVVVSQIIGGIGLVLWYFSTGGNPANLQAEVMALATHPITVMLFSSLSQLGFAGVAIAGGWLSPQPLRERLGFVRPTLPWWGIGVAIIGALVPLLVGVSGAIWLTHYIKPDPSLKMLFEKMTPALGLPFILYIALAPGFCEEMFFRGYVQRRLLERWSGWTAVLVASVVFGLFHVMPHAILAAFPLGIWLGILAWRTGSIWPGIVCHATVNGVWNVRNVGMALGYIPKETPLTLVLGLGVVGLVAFVWALWLMFATPTRLKTALESP